MEKALRQIGEFFNFFKTADILYFLRRTPPLTAQKSNAADGPPTAKNSGTVRSFPSVRSIVALLFCAVKGRPESEIPVAGYFSSGSESWNSQAAGLPCF